MRKEGHGGGLVQVGWVMAAGEQESGTVELYHRARDRLRDALAGQFPQFQWDLPLVVRGICQPSGMVDSLSLLEIGVQEKVARGWDFCLVVVPNELRARSRLTTLGVPSSPLEVAVLSDAHLRNEGEERAESIAAIALHLLGHLWGLEHGGGGAMRPLQEDERLRLEPFHSRHEAAAIDRLEEVADERVEEAGKKPGWMAFIGRTFAADPKGILQDVIGSAPWQFPFRLGRLTAAGVVTMLVLLMTAEAWEVGTQLRVGVLLGATVAAIVCGTMYVFVGQNLAELTRGAGMREQLMRSWQVLFLGLLLGMLMLWVVLAGVAAAVIWLVPEGVGEGWVGVELTVSHLGRLACFMAGLGVLAGALGANLEDEDKLKAQLFFDEET